MSTPRTLEMHSLEEFAFHLAENNLERYEILQHGLLKAANAIVKVAQSEIGEYQPATGPFLEWELLAQSTEDDKARKGFKLDAPLLRNGDLRDSYEAEVHALEAIAGSKDPVALYQEAGTSRIPPREVIGPAAIRARKKIEKALGTAYVESLLLQPDLGDLLGKDGD